MLCIWCGYWCLADRLADNVRPPQEHIQKLLNAIDDDKDRVYTSRPCKYVCFRLVKKMPTAYKADTLLWTHADAGSNDGHASVCSSPSMSQPRDGDAAVSPMSRFKMQSLDSVGESESRRAAAAGVFGMLPQLRDEPCPPNHAAALAGAYESSVI